MSDFLNFVLSYLWRALFVAVCAAVFGVGALWIAVKKHRREHGPEIPFPWARAVLSLMLVGYLSIVLFVTLGRSSFYNGRANLHLLRAWREAWNSFNERQWLNILLNIAMFIPLGFLVPLIWKRLQKWPRMLTIGFGTSLFIEIMQYLKGSGLFDVDDLFNNTLGAMIGFCLLMTALSLMKKQWASTFCHMVALAITAGAIGGIFAAYEIQEYGNLPSAPSFRTDTTDIQWTVSCPLDRNSQTVDIYNTDPWTKTDCELFGRSFLENLGAAQIDITIYNDEIYLRDFQGSRILEVFYRDGTYHYADLDMSRVFTKVEEQTLRDALLDFGIQVPDGAEFSCPDGQTHYFRVDRYIDGNIMTDGTIAVQYEDGHGIRTIHNSLVHLTYYGQEEIISSQAAVHKLMEGNLTNGDWFLRNNPRQMEILSCELSYQTDTKGYYQPVYLVWLMDPTTGHLLEETVAAIP